MAGYIACYLLTYLLVKKTAAKWIGYLLAPVVGFISAIISAGTATLLSDNGPLHYESFLGLTSLAAGREAPFLIAFSFAAAGMEHYRQTREPSSSQPDMVADLFFGALIIIGIVAAIGYAATQV